MIIKSFLSAAKFPQTHKTLLSRSGKRELKNERVLLNILLSVRQFDLIPSKQIV